MKLFRLFFAGADISIVKVAGLYEISLIDTGETLSSGFESMNIAILEAIAKRKVM